jgi:Calcineurin-like phosphoesterase
VVALVLSLALATSTSASTHDPVVAAAGDIVCDPRPHLGSNIESMLGGCQSNATYALIANKNLAALLVLGDAQYEDGALDAYRQAYAASWGRLKQITHPTTGNHDYYTSKTADGYFDFFGAAAGPRTKGYYSFQIGRWHVIALNGNCSFVGGCGARSDQERWLRADLASHRAACTLAFWHQPRFSSGTHGSDPAYSDFWRDLYAAHADIVLAGHDHDYERFDPQTPAGDADPKMGIREFVVGTGGRSHSLFLKIAQNSESRAAGTFGVLFLTLHANAYDWHFTPTAGYSFSDGGSGVCHGRR